MQELFAQIYETLGKMLPVYPTYDAVPVENKPELFAVLGLGDTVLSAPAVTENGLLHVFQTEVTVTILLPVYGDFRKAVDCFYETVVPAMLSMDCAVERIHTQSVAVDLKLRRLTFAGSFHLKGMYLVPGAEKEESV